MFEWLKSAAPVPGAYRAPLQQRRRVLKSTARQRLARAAAEEGREFPKGEKAPCFTIYNWLRKAHFSDVISSISP